MISGFPLRRFIWDRLKEKSQDTNTFLDVLHTVPIYPIYVSPEMKLCGLVPNFYIDVSVSDLYIPWRSNFAGVEVSTDAEILTSAMVLSYIVWRVGFTLRRTFPPNFSA
jgi:hypothetical protein